MTRIIAIPLGYVLNALYSFLDNYALSIIIFTVLIRLIILPLYNMQMRSSMQMQEIQPLVKEIQAKYKGDPERMNDEMQALYSEHKVNPAAGCLPLLIQLPIIWGLFALLRNPMNYISNTDMILASHSKFFWVQDLSQPDLWVLPIIAGVATFISMKISTAMTMQPGSAAANNPANTSMKAMQYFMPVMIVWMGRTLPAGLCIYWIISYIFQIFQIKVIRGKAKKKKEEEKYLNASK